jgi:hypothetical protein
MPPVISAGCDSLRAPGTDGESVLEQALFNVPTWRGYRVRPGIEQNGNRQRLFSLVCITETDKP